MAKIAMLHALNIVNRGVRIAEEITGQRVAAFQVLFREPCLPVSLKRDLATMRRFPKKFLRTRAHYFPGDQHA